MVSQDGFGRFEKMVDIIHKRKLGTPLLIFISLLMMDLIARTGYQAIKSPILPLFAKSIGAESGETGFIIGISTIIGLLFSPFVGTLSDIYGRRRLLLFGTLMFAFTPFLYLWVNSAEQLIMVRLIHGFATATYGPVIAASVADLYSENRTFYMGWYRTVRNAGYLFGPISGGLLLTYNGFTESWVILGIISFLAFFPTLIPDFQRKMEAAKAAQSTLRLGSLRSTLFNTYKDKNILRLGIIQAILFLGLRANKAFLPIIAIEKEITPAQIATVLSIQVLATLISQPIWGFLADRLGFNFCLKLGLGLVAVGITAMVLTGNLLLLIALGIFMGLGEGAIMPVITSIATTVKGNREYGSSLGVLDAMDNVGKALGPILAGFLIGFSNYFTAFSIISLGILFFIFLPIPKASVPKTKII
jgi:MFS family permease